MKIEVDLPDQTIRKIKAFHVLSGGGAGDFDEVLGQLIDQTVSQEIVSQLGISADQLNSPSAPVSGAAAQIQHQNQTPQNVQGATVASEDTNDYVPEKHPDDITGLSSGLGDDDPYDDEDEGVEPVQDPNEMIPKSGGLTDEVLERDTNVEDPEHEAAQEAVQDGPPDQAEDLFASSLNIPKPDRPKQTQGNEEPQTGPEPRRRRPVSKSRGKVSPMTEVPR